MGLSILSTVTMNNGKPIPLLGFGTYKLADGQEAESAVAYALQCGYRHVDTAAVYKNEESVGRAIKASGVPREQIFVTTKLWNDDHDDVVGACGASLKRLGLDYVDLYLMHWPVEGKRLTSWKTMEWLQSEGKARSIGVSNFTIRHLGELLENCEIIPVVDQVEFSPYLYQKDLIAYCREKNIQVEAYSPLTKGRRIDDSRLIDLAKKYQRTPAQVLLRWGLQHGLIVLPKSKTLERIKSNAEIFDFEIIAEDMAVMDGWNEDLRLSWDPTDMQ